MHLARSIGLLASAFVLIACGSAPPPDPAAPSTGSVAPVASAAPEDSAAPAATAAPSAIASAAPLESPAPAAAAVVPEKASAGTPLTGKISQKTIMDLVLKHGELFNDCYTIGAGGSKQFVATVTVKLSIGPTGIVNATQVVKSTAKNPKVDKCVADAFKKMPFPATGSTVPITFPMEFSGAEEIRK